MQKPAISLFTYLFTALGILTGFSILASVVAWFLLDDISQNFSRLATYNSQVLASSRQLARNAGQISLLAPQVARTRSFSELNELYEDIQERLDSMVSSLTNLRSGASGTPDLAGHIDNTLRELVREFGGLKSVAEHQIRLRQERSKRHQVLLDRLAKLQERLARAREINEDRIMASAELAFDPGSEIDEVIDEMVGNHFDTEVISTISQASLRFETALEQLRLTRDPNGIDQHKSNLDLNLRRMVSQSVSLSDAELRQLFSTALQDLYQEATAAIGPAEIQTDIYQNGLTLLEADGQVQLQVEALQNFVDAIVSNLESTNAREQAEVIEQSEFAAQIWQFNVIFSLVLSIGIIWFLIIGQVARPLRDLTQIVRKINRQDLDFEVPHYGTPELNALTQTLEVARDHALNLAEHQQQLDRNNRDLTRINRDLNAFLRVASHDLKTPIHGIRLLIQFIREDIDEQAIDLAMERTGLMMTRVDRLDRLLDALLSYTQIESGSPQLAHYPLVERIEQCFEALREDRDFELSIESDDAQWRVVPEDLDIILEKLVTNAIKHHDRDSGRLRFRFNETPTEYVLEIEDDGPGIDTRFAETIFEPFQTLKPKDEVDGSGLGLAHIKRLIEFRGGRISWYPVTENGRGSRFVVFYPRLDEPAA